MQNKKGRRKPYIFYALALVLIVGIVVVVRTRQAAARKPEIRTAFVDRGTVTSTVSANGTLQPLRTVEVKSNVGGSIVKLAVDEGDIVKAGQLIARIDPSDTQTALDQSQADLAAAVSKVDQARQTLTMQHDQDQAQIASAKTKLLQAQEQAKVQPLLTAASVKQSRSSYEAAVSALKQTKTAVIPQKLSSAQAGYDQAKATFDASESDYSRQKALLAKGFVSKSAVEASAQKYGVAKGALDSAKSKLDTIKDETAGDLSSAEAKMQQAKADLDNALANQVQDKLKRQEVASAEAALRVALAAQHQDRIKTGDIVQANAQVTRSQASLKNAVTQLGYTTVTAPSAGIVTKKYVEEGSIVTAGRSSAVGAGSGVGIVDIADTTQMFALVSVDETDIAQIEVGQSVDITVEAYPDELFTGKVTKIAPQSVVDQSVTTIPVTVEVDIPDSRLKPGMNVTCDFTTDRKDNVLMVLNEAIRQTDNVSTVTVLVGDKQITREVETGLIGRDYTEIVKGLKRGEKIVTAIVYPTAASGSSGFGGGSRSSGGGRPGGMMMR